ncbi:hypothetical protein FB567DRAFT_520729 [Paraphoma chrysanthemicola]|uniref:Uncharacterized protein n=1 Tax=Paraphoma chrysanthemicola TaxID=798071 RepID=A0A8K0R8I1_9PLEO|nr:hypothetical protein FB567DRAFT_520729 [Paraphoma chrysanthemicola]
MASMTLHDIAYVAFSALGHGWLVNNFDYSSPDDFTPDDVRRTVAKFQGGSYHKNKDTVVQIQKLAKRKGCTTPQPALMSIASQESARIRRHASPGYPRPQKQVLPVLYSTGMGTYSSVCTNTMLRSNARAQRAIIVYRITSRK